MTITKEQASKFLQEQFKMTAEEIQSAITFQLHLSIEEKDERAIKEAIANGASLSEKFRLYNDTVPLNAYERATKHAVRLVNIA